MMIKRFIQQTVKVSGDTMEELSKNVNKLCASSEYPIIIRPTIGDYTDIKQWYLVNYYKQI